MYLARLALPETSFFFFYDDRCTYAYEFNKHGQMCARSPMAFGRDVFDFVFAQPNGPIQIKSPKTQLLKKVNEVQ